MEKKKSKLQWHPAFCSATELELREDRKNLVFYREYPLSKQPDIQSVEGGEYYV